MLPVREFIEREWKPRILPVFKPSTQSSYRANLETHILPRFGETRLRELRKGDVQQWLTALSQNGLSRQTIKNIWAVFSSVLRTAMDWEYLKQNPAQGVRFPPRQPKARVFLPTAEQLDQLLAKLSEPAFTLALLLIGTGLRVGEAVGLCWGDIDFGGRKLTVARDIWHGKINSPKYAASERVVPLGPVLAEHLLNQAKGPEQWVFEGNSGKPLDPRYLARRQFYPVLDELEIPRFSWHRLRKLHSTYLADLGVAPRVLQAQLGHADAALTLNVYAQVLPESQRKAVEALEGLLFRNVPKPASEGRVQ